MNLRKIYSVSNIDSGTFFYTNYLLKTFKFSRCALLSSKTVSCRSISIILLERCQNTREPSRECLPVQILKISLIFLIWKSNCKSPVPNNPAPHCSISRFIIAVCIHLMKNVRGRYKIKQTVAAVPMSYQVFGQLCYQSHEKTSCGFLQKLIFFYNFLQNYRILEKMQKMLYQIAEKNVEKLRYFLHFFCRI